MPVVISSLNAFTGLSAGHPDGLRAPVVVVPGYGMAVSQNQHAAREMARPLEAKGVEVEYAIHPSPGACPGT